MADIELQGQKEFSQAMVKLVKSVKPDKIEPILKRAAAVVTREAKKTAPVRKKQGTQTPKPPGVLKRAIKTKQLKRIYGNAAPSISAIDRDPWRGAPHAHFVHDGTGERVGKRGHRPYKGKKFGKMKPNPFFEEAWTAKRDRVLDYVTKQVQKLLGGAAKK